jgi:hypothetical protein
MVGVGLGGPGVLVGVSVIVGVIVGVFVGVTVGVGVGVLTSIPVKSQEGAGVLVGVTVDVTVGVGVLVGVTVDVTVGVGVIVGVTVGVGEGQTIVSPIKQVPQSTYSLNDDTIYWLLTGTSGTNIVHPVNPLLTTPYTVPKVIPDGNAPSLNIF